MRFFVIELATEFLLPGFLSGADLEKITFKIIFFYNKAIGF